MMQFQWTILVRKAKELKKIEEKKRRNKEIREGRKDEKVGKKQKKVRKAFVLIIRKLFFILVICLYK